MNQSSSSLSKLMDWTLSLSILLLLLHLGCAIHQTLRQMFPKIEWFNPILILIINHTLHYKIGSFTLLMVFLIGLKSKKQVKTRKALATLLFVIGIAIWCLVSPDTFGPAWYYALAMWGAMLMILTGGTWWSRYLKRSLRVDVFNIENETFPQEERYLNNQYAIHFKASYYYKGRFRNSWINIINPFRGLLVVGTPGAGKSYFVVRNIIIQQLQKGFTMLLYDFKYDDLSRLAYNVLRRSRNQSRFYVIDFDELQYRCNPLALLDDIADAAESSRTIMLGLNKDWIKKQGDFFVESPINFVTALIWFLRKYQNGSYCTLPHVIELMQVEYKTLFPLLHTEPEVSALINPFESAYVHEAWEQLEGQMASAKMAMARLVSPKMYYVLSGNDFHLDLNNPSSPKVLCLANNPQKQEVYGPVLSLYISRAIKLINKKNQLPCSLIFDEFPTIYFNHIDNLMATARSNRVATTLAVQDYSQLKKEYGRDQAEVIMNLAGNVISGQVLGDTAKVLSERFGKVVQERYSYNSGSGDISISEQLNSAIPAARISSLSSGEFVGMVADQPDQEIELKLFHAKIINDHISIQRQERRFRSIPTLPQPTWDELEHNYLMIRQDIQALIQDKLYPK
ncbi:type IV secretory system conjugative DNA transfer family protein [Fulvivirga ligni]|uniref:type IV secretory system conjugative DNA transfer family protein n=1 Tax=Fulvivirga ligni TaxID=2904246 RepID=UPI001F1A02F6|nr:type IV secretory system conjugative DNA transfer family protein [Fulvivirga ligni]UII20810.1 type IV secretory system conjugative DNA transfer family protein [Fulvivirga ligni]